MELVRLERWERAQAVQYFSEFVSEAGQKIGDPESVYDELCDRLGPDHPVLHRPFLVYRLASLLADSKVGAGQLAQELGSSPVQVVPNVIQAMLKREVEEKWRDPSGQPYLTLDQHVLLLSAIAEEMWNQGKNSLSTDVVQLICETVIEMLNIAPSRRVQIIQRVKAHALLPPSATSSSELSFDHEEFLNYFLAARLVHLLQTRDQFALHRFCELHSLPSIVGVWTANIAPWNAQQVKEIIDRFNHMTRTEVRSSYLKQNAGLLSSQMADLHGHEEKVAFGFNSMYFEGDDFRNAHIDGSSFAKCTFMNVDISGSQITRANSRAVE